MQTKKQYIYDKSNWPDGPWIHEPDEVQYQDVDTDLPCLIKRNYTGALCGYVGVLPGHKLHGINYHYNKLDELYSTLDVHGGVTYTGLCDVSRSCKFYGVCNDTDPEEPKHIIWWIGFDCNHFQDFAPACNIGLNDRLYNYRTISYVKEECSKLAKQLKVIGAQ